MVIEGFAMAADADVTMKMEKPFSEGQIVAVLPRVRHVDLPGPA